MADTAKNTPQEQFAEAIKQADALYKHYVDLARIARSATSEEPADPMLMRTWSFPLGLTVRQSGNAIVE